MKIVKIANDVCLALSQVVIKTKALIQFHKILEILGFALLDFNVKMFVQIIHQDNMVLIKDRYKIKTQKQ